MEYRNFSVRFEPLKGAEYNVIVVDSPVGQGHGIFTLPFDRSKLGAIYDEMWDAVDRSRRVGSASDLARDVRSGPVSPRTPECVGAQLFQALFRGEVRSCYDASRGWLSARKDSGLRFKFQWNPDQGDLAVLGKLPWEYLYDTGTRHFLNLSHRTPVVRDLDVLKPATPPPLRLPLRILVVISLPKGVRPLDLGSEQAAIKTAWANSKDVEVTVLERATLIALRTELRDQPYHVIHFMGHGDFDEETGHGALLLENEDGDGDVVRGKDLATLLSDALDLRLVVLNACDTATAAHADGLDPFTGVATALVMQGAPAVVAMQYPISDGAAINFSNAFYQRLSLGDTVDAAATEGRMHVFMANRESLEWGTPVVFARHDDLRLVDPNKPRVLAAGSRREPVDDDTRLSPEGGYGDATTGPGIQPTHAIAVTTQPDETNAESCILIVTVTKVEAQAVLNTCHRLTGKKPNRQTIGNKTYYSLGIHGAVPVFMVQQSAMGTATPGGAVLTVRQAIQDLRPQAVIMCGIAFGLHPDKQALGDILIAQQIQYYEPQKVDSLLGQMPRGDRTMSSERLLDRFRAGDIYWQGAQTHFGLVVSGEKLVNHPDFRDWLLRNEPEAVGGDMEGAGLYAAARDAKVDWILVKAICDWADGEKVTTAQPLAAENAAEFVLHVVQMGGWNGCQEFPAPPEPAGVCEQPSSASAKLTWVRLDTVAGGRWRYRIDPSTYGAVREPIPEARRGRESPPPRGSGGSLAMAPDGSLIAAIDKQMLWLLTVNSRNGDYWGYGEPITIAMKSRSIRVLAVAPQGNQNVWLALADGDNNVYRASLVEKGEGKLDQPVRISSIDRDAGATFLGADLLFVRDGIIQTNSPGTTKYAPWEKHPANNRVLALDAAKVKGHTYVVCLATPLSSGEGGAKRIVVLEEVESTRKCTVDVDADAVSVQVVRAPDGDCAKLRVLLGVGHEFMTISPCQQREQSHSQRTLRGNRVSGRATGSVAPTSGSGT